MNICEMNTYTKKPLYLIFPTSYTVLFTLFFLGLNDSKLLAQVYEYKTTKLSQWNSAGTTYSDIWGYAANGREYAILGSATTIYFFDVTNPSSPVLVDQFGPFTATSWREFKTYGHYAYAVTDGPDAGGLRIFDLRSLPDTVIQVRQTTAFFTKCHMPFIDEAQGRLYCAGTNTRSDGIIVLDLSVRPDSPSIVINQALPGGYVHDVYVRNNIMYTSHLNYGFSIYNCSGTACGPELTRNISGGLNHSSWMDGSGSWLVNADETGGLPLRLLPMTSPTTIEVANIKRFKSKTLREQYPGGSAADTFSIGHNPYIVGVLVYASYYTDGVQVFNIANPNNITRIAYFDTDRGHTSYSPVFRGCWGVYPFLPSGNILASDIQSGMWIFKLNPSALALQYSSISGKVEGLKKISLTVKGLASPSIQNIYLEKSRDGVVFSELQKISNWQSNVEFTIQVLDGKVYSYNYYRLKSILEDGTVAYSEITTITIPITTFQFWPNPIRNQLYFISPQEIKSLTITDVQGRMIITVLRPDTGMTLPNAMISGVYFLQFVTDTRQWTERVVVHR